VSAGRAALAAGVAVVALLGASVPASSDAPPTASAAAGDGRGGVKKRPIGRFSYPVHVTAAPGVRALYVVEQAGRVRVIKKRKRPRPFLSIRGKVRFSPFGEEGLLSVAFHPDFRTNRLAYVYYTNNAGNNVVAEVRARKRNPLVARRKTLRTVLAIPHPGQSNHNGGQIAFGPDGLLYIGIGDGGGAQDADNSAQDRGSLLGKIIRIDPRRSGGSPYTVPPGNPFVGEAGRDEIYSLGLRNPYRFSIDPNGGKPRIAIGDVGQEAFEEIDYEPLANARGANFGWNDFEGFRQTSFGQPPVPSQVKPVLAYSTHSGGRCAVVGGVVVRGGGLRSLRGRYLFGDFCDGELRSFVARTRRARGSRRLGIRVPSLSSLGLGRGGKLYATSLEGPVYRLKRSRR
jgi:glucose/arabinose dehydrogenase